jgi:hypothetical protein
MCLVCGVKATGRAVEAFSCRPAVVLITHAGLCLSFALFDIEIVSAFGVCFIFQVLIARQPVSFDPNFDFGFISR